MPPLFASKSPFFVPVRQKFSHPVHGLPHFPLWQAALLFAEMFCRTGASSLCCCTSVLCFADEKSFPQKCGIQSVKGRSLFPHVENPVEKVQKSCFKACFTGGIPHFPPCFQHSGSTCLFFLRTVCKIQVGNMTIFWTAFCPVLPDLPISFWRMWISVEKNCLLFIPFCVMLLRIFWIFVDFLFSAHPNLRLIPALVSASVRQGWQLHRKSACLDWF